MAFLGGSFGRLSLGILLAYSTSLENHNNISWMGSSDSWNDRQPHPGQNGRNAQQMHELYQIIVLKLVGRRYGQWSRTRRSIVESCNSFAQIDSNSFNSALNCPKSLQNAQKRLKLLQSHDRMLKSSRTLGTGLLEFSLDFIANFCNNRLRNDLFCKSHMNFRDLVANCFSPSAMQVMSLV